MARLFTVGFQSGALASEPVTFVTNNAALTLASPTTLANNGDSSAHIIVHVGTLIVRCTVSAADTTGPYFGRMYCYFVSFAASGASDLLGFTNAAFNSFLTIAVTSAGVLQLFNGSTQVGSNSSALSLNTWYRLEMQYDNTGGAGAGVLSGLINGVSFASSSSQTLTNVNQFTVGCNYGNHFGGSGEFYFDDIAVNNSASGSLDDAAQNGLPGPTNYNALFNRSPHVSVGDGMSRSEVAN